MFAASWPLRDRMLLVPIVVGVVVYVAAILALRVLDENDRRYVRGALARVGLRSSRVSAPVSPEGRRGVSEL
jgi:hypothetical protein